MYGFAGDLIEPDNLVFLAAAIQAAALLFQGQTKIRVILLVGSLTYIAYYTLAADEPLWEAMIATLAMACANVVGLTAHLLGKNVRLIPAHQLSLYAMMGGVEPGEFRALMKHARVRRLKKDETLTTVGEVPGQLYYVIEGDIEIEQGEGRFRIPPRHFIGEVSLMLGTPASATVHAKAGAQVVEWPRDRLVRTMARKPELMIAVESLLGRDMARKVATAASCIDSKYTNTGNAIEMLI